MDQKKKSLVLLILDGWGIGEKNHSNPLYIGKPSRIAHIKTHYLSGALQSSGIAVGLPWNEEGNSEVGHLTIGAGKVIYQHYPRITLEIERGDFFKNPVVVKAIAHAKENGSAVNLVGLLTEGNVHASLDHVHALLRAAKEQGAPRVNLHFFGDGKDSGPKSVRSLPGKSGAMRKEFGIGELGSLSGRFYALDRDNHWDRTEKAYRALVGLGPKVTEIDSKIQEQYDKGLNDAFLEPVVVGGGEQSIHDNDTVIFFDFREESVRQITSPFVLKDFDKFTTQEYKNLYVATMTHYSDAFPVPVISESERVERPLGSVLAEENYLQLRIAETEKYAHVTYFFNGYRESPFKNEYRVLIPSKNVAHQDEAPEMMAREITARVVESVTEGAFNFILANFANADMMGHTGNFDAALQAIQVVDECVSNIMDACLERDVPLMITSDHGNVERMLDPLTGYIETTHDPNFVPLYLIGHSFEREKSEEAADNIEHEAAGILSDVAPTILDLLGLEKPNDMTGESLIHRLR